MVYEGSKETAAVVIVSSTAVDTMQLGDFAGMTDLSLGRGPERAVKGVNGNTAEHSRARPEPVPPAATAIRA